MLKLKRFFNNTNIRSFYHTALLLSVLFTFSACTFFTDITSDPGNSPDEPEIPSESEEPPEPDKTIPPKIPIPFTPWKLVPVQFCIVDDGRNFPALLPDKAPNTNGFLGKPDARFNNVKLINGLMDKNRLFAGTGLIFIPVFPTLIIPDPHPNQFPWIEGGEVGDVADPGGGLSDPEYEPEPHPEENPDFPRGPRPGEQLRPPPITGKVQWKAIRDKCLADPKRVKGAMLEIVIRRWVTGHDDDNDGLWDEDTLFDGIDFDRDGPDGEDKINVSKLLGKSPKPPCSPEPPAIDKTPTVADPDGMPARRFGHVLAHEDGHALCLGHALAGAAPRLMSPTVPPYVGGFTNAEIVKLRAQGQHIHITRDKQAGGDTIYRAGPITAEELDVQGDAASPQSDLYATAVSYRADGSMGFLGELAGVLPAKGAGGLWRFVVDVDANANTGIAVEQKDIDTFYGADLMLEANLMDGPKVNVIVKHAVKGYWQRVNTKPKTRLEPVVVDTPDGTEFPLAHALFIVIPAEGLPAKPVNGYRTLSSFENNSVVDVAPVLIGSVDPVPFSDRPTIKLTPVQPHQSEKLQITGIDFTPKASVSIYVGAEMMEQTKADAEGNIKLTLTVPEPNPEKVSLLEDGGYVTYVVAVEYGRSSDGMILIVKE